jgi:hypothetical protein
MTRGININDEGALSLGAKVGRKKTVKEVMTENCFAESKMVNYNL